MSISNQEITLRNTDSTLSMDNGYEKRTIKSHVKCTYVVENK